MYTFQKFNITAHGANKNAIVLRSDRDFEKWYQEQFDFSIFPKKGAEEVMDEERPEYYPCISLILEGGNGVVFLGEDLVQLWLSKLYTIKTVPL